MFAVRDARIGHIIGTLRKHERQHPLGVELRRDVPANISIRGLFSTSQISKLFFKDYHRLRVCRALDGCCISRIW